MEQIGLFDAKNHFSQLLKEVQKGKTFLITRHGEPAAKLEPIQPVVDRQKIAKEVKAFLKMKKSKRLKSALRKV